MKLREYLNEIKTSSTSGTMYGVVHRLDTEFKNKKLKSSITLKTDKITIKFEKGSLISNLKGGIFIKMTDRTEEPTGSNKEWGVLVTSSKENISKIESAI